MTILALETSTNRCSVALLNTGQLLAERLVERQTGQSQQIIPMIDEMLTEAEIALTDLAAIAVSTGPGSFVGVRIAIGVAQGLATAADLPVIAVSSLAAYAQNAYRLAGIGSSLVAVNAHMGELYLGCYKAEQGIVTPVFADKLIKPSELTVPDQALRLLGDAWEVYATEIAFQPDSDALQAAYFPHAHDVALLAEYQLSQGRSINPEELQACYLRDKTAWS